MLRLMLRLMLLLVLLLVPACWTQAQDPAAPPSKPPPVRDGLFEILDQNGDGLLEPTELNTAAQRLLSLDTDQDGKLSVAEIAAVNEPVPTGINKTFLSPDLDPKEWMQRFEIESREVYAARDQVVAAVLHHPGSDIADIGAGTGLYTGLFAHATGKRGKVYAVDISPRLIEHLRKRVLRERLTNVEVVHSESNSIKLPPNSIDIAFICDTYHHFEQHAEMLRSIRQALRPKGSLILIDFERIPGKSREFILGHVRAGKQVFRREVERSGFDFVKEVKLPGFEENYFLRFQKHAETAN